MEPMSIMGEGSAGQAHRAAIATLEICRHRPSTNTDWRQYHLVVECRYARRDAGCPPQHGHEGHRWPLDESFRGIANSEGAPMNATAKMKVGLTMVSAVLGMSGSVMAAPPADHDIYRDISSGVYVDGCQYSPDGVTCRYINVRDLYDLHGEYEQSYIQIREYSSVGPVYSDLFVYCPVERGTVKVWGGAKHASVNTSVDTQGQGCSSSGYSCDYSTGTCTPYGYSGIISVVITVSDPQTYVSEVSNRRTVDPYNETRSVCQEYIGGQMTQRSVVVDGTVWPVNSASAGQTNCTKSNRVVK